ncbi:cytochrome bc1 complex Rieske iron-sulfur subunit [Rhizohabitans arisaemae]|uniref:cytochrome bc1 complex Rieske iron-sulfur subunit n=1 Tax=Rhizohabitans arisaemae TaxID=2720610 RepID=UPI0024B0D7DB|nr:Rieske 2Fe-2S domain-containing protein [Rhizohabitans arisaemae]
MTEHDENSAGWRSPKRVVGTPSPAESRYTLGQAEPPSPKTPVIEGVEPRDEGKGAERVVALCFLITFLAGIAFIVFYVMFQVGTIEKAQISNLALGGTLALALLALATGVTVWVRAIMPKYHLVQERHPLVSDEATRDEVGSTFLQGAAESGIPKRRLLRRTLLLAVAPLGLLPLVLLKDLGPLPGTVLRHTVWGKKTKEGKERRLIIEGTGNPIRAANFNSPGGILSVVPEGYEHDLNELAKSTLILIKFRPEELKAGTNKNWTVDGIVAYSKICTHVGCPTALYEQTTHHILCPCHQSTFDATDGARVIFGPAARPLPQLPLGLDAEGYLVAKGDFPVPPGPSFWERGDAEAEVRAKGGHA